MDSFETKSNQVREHLIVNGTITSWEAIQKYHATRLSAIIFNLRKQGYVIDSEWESSIDKEGRTSRFVRYILKNREEYFEENMNHIPRID